MPRDFMTDLERIKQKVREALGDIRCSVVIEVPTDTYEPYVYSEECEDVDEVTRRLYASEALAEIEWFVRSYVFEMPDEVELTDRVKLVVW